MVYLDYNASAPMPDSVVAAMTEAARLSGNPSSVHEYGRKARAVVEAARRDVAALVGVAPEQVVFTSGATEANALALQGCGRPRVLVAATEHQSVLRAIDAPTRLSVGADGLLAAETLARHIGTDGGDAVVSVMLANNETGAVQPIAELATVAAERGALMHCDAVQAPGRLALDFAALRVDAMSLSAHKIGGPKGVGALVVKSGLVLTPEMRGGGQERGLRGGTENLPGIAGFGAAARAARRALATAAEVARLRDRLEGQVRELAPDAVIFGAAAPRLPNTSCIGLPGLAAETQVMALDLAGIAVSAGAACSSGKVETSHVLRAMGVDEPLARCAIRVSLGSETRAAEIDRFLAAWTDLARRRSRSAA